MKRNESSGGGVGMRRSRRARIGDMNQFPCHLARTSPLYSDTPSLDRWSPRCEVRAATGVLVWWTRMLFAPRQAGGFVPTGDSQEDEEIPENLTNQMWIAACTFVARDNVEPQASAGRDAIELGAQLFKERGDGEMSEFGPIAPMASGVALRARLARSLEKASPIVPPYCHRYRS